MSSALHLSVASTGFEAARHLTSLPANHPSQGVHGHSFEATVLAELPSDRNKPRASTIETLKEALESAIAPLNYTDLNRHFDVPSDENLARWVQNQLQVPGIYRVAIQSTARQGVALQGQHLVHIWRKFRFQAAHRLPYVPLGHKCGRMHGHSFEVILHTQQMPGDRVTNLGYDQLDAAWAPLQQQLHYRCLNEIEGLENPTSELIGRWIWERLKPRLPELAWVTVFETGSCGAHFNGHQYRIWKEFSFDSAVVVNSAALDSPRRRLHGYTYTLRLHLTAPLDAVMGWTIDFSDVKSRFEPLFRAIDHQPLYELAGLTEGDTASVAAWIMNKARSDLPELERIDLFETPGCGTILAAHTNEPMLPV